MKIHHKDKNAISQISNSLRRLIGDIDSTKEITIVCIGTDRSTGDCLGPLIGSKLQGLNCNVLGTIDNPVHAGNLINAIASIPSDRIVIAIDACLGTLSEVGVIGVSGGPIKPGAAVGKDIAPVGDISIIGIVNVSGFMDHLVLQSTRLSVVMAIAEVITLSVKGVFESVDQLEVAATL